MSIHPPSGWFCLCGQSPMFLAHASNAWFWYTKERGTPARPSSVFGFYSIFTVYQTASTNSSTAAPQIT